MSKQQTGNPPVCRREGIKGKGVCWPNNIPAPARPQALKSGGITLDCAAGRRLFDLRKGKWILPLLSPQDMRDIHELTRRAIEEIVPKDGAA